MKDQTETEVKEIMNELKTSLQLTVEERLQLFDRVFELAHRERTNDGKLDRG